VAHVSGASGQFSGGNRVSSSDDGDGSLVLGKIGQDVDDTEGSLGEGLHLENTHGSVHDDGPAVSKGSSLLLGGIRTVVKSHPAIRDGIGGDDLGLGISGELVGDDNIGRKKDGLSKLLGLGHDHFGSLNEVVLNKRVTNSESLGLQEGENHTSSDDDNLALVKKGFQDGDLGGDLGSSNDGGHGSFSVLDGSVKVFEFLGKKESRNRRLQELGDTLGGGVGTMGSSESVVNEKVERGGKLLNESRLVLGLLLVESGVLKHDNISIGGLANNGGNFLTDAVRGEGDILSKKLGHALGAGCEGEFVLRAILGTSQVRADSDDGSLALQVFDGGDGRTDAGIISDLLSVKGDIDITSDKNFLSLKLIIGKVRDGLLGLKLSDRSRTESV
jgi:hypothetical protein